MTLTPTATRRSTGSRPGRQLMVLDDAETIARQARRRAAQRRRRRESLKQAGALGAVLGVAAIVLGAPVPAVLGVLLALAVVLGVAARQLVGRQQVRRRRQSMRSGPGIGTPRPKGGFSTTRHRSGAPVWVSDRAA